MNGISEDDIIKARPKMIAFLDTLRHTLEELSSDLVIIRSSLWNSCDREIRKEKHMTKMYIMGNYTEKAFQGFLKDPNSDRKAVVEKLVQGVGGKLHTMDIVRGSYDFCVVADLPSFDDFAAVKLVVKMTGAVKTLVST